MGPTRKEGRVSFHNSACRPDFIEYPLFMCTVAAFLRTRLTYYVRKDPLVCLLNVEYIMKVLYFYYYLGSISLHFSRFTRMFFHTLLSASRRPFYAHFMPILRPFQF